jgi:hypothetical protein
MLGSTASGEVLSAARQAERLRHQAGMTWRDLIVDVPQLAPAADIDDHDFDLDAALDACFARLWLLSDWEEGFVRSISHRRRRLSPKQAAVIKRLHAKVRPR